MTNDFLKLEFIGLPIKINKSNDKNIENVEGEIIDETKNMFIIQTENGIKKIAKNSATFEINGNHVIGSEIVYRSEDRIRKIK